MSYIKVGKENSRDIELHYQDYGQGKPAILIHGYPQNGTAWEKQIPTLIEAGYRVITYDRRGFGESTKPFSGYDWDTFADDLNEVINYLNVSGVTLIGHSMGTGEITRYLSKYGTAKIEKAVLISPIQPFLLKTDDNPNGLDGSIFGKFEEGAKEDRYAFFTQFFDSFYSSGLIGKNGVSKEALQANMQVAALASPIATYACIQTWISDFRADVPKVTVPTLIIQGTGDKVLPFPLTGEKLEKLLPNCELSKIDGAPHGLLWTHSDDVNRALVDFLASARLEKSVA